jgi:hypothetical protein
LSALIPLARVKFAEAVNVPGVTPEGKPFQYPCMEEVLLSTQVPILPGVRGAQRFELWLDTRVGQVLVTNPKSGETERYPFSLTRGIRYLEKPGAKVDEPDKEPAK